MEKQSIKIKIKKKGGHGGGHHGGSWKVAYADFVTAMMAFFLLMWLVTAQKATQKVGLAEYFKEYDVTKGEADIKKKIDKKIEEFKAGSERNSGNPLPIKLIFEKDADSSRKILYGWESEVHTKLADVSDQVKVEIMDDGTVMIQLVDNEGEPMFPSGSSEITDVAKKILAVVWEKIKFEEVKIAIEGHTDSSHYSANGKTNWELSTERASAARKELERLGVLSNRLIRVSGLADTKLISKDPFSPSNRRISLLLYYQLSPEPPPVINFETEKRETKNPAETVKPPTDTR